MNDVQHDHAVVDTQHVELEGCKLQVVDGHIEADCKSKEAGQQLAGLLEKEVIIHVKPKVAQV